MCTPSWTKPRATLRLLAPSAFYSRLESTLQSGYCLRIANFRIKYETLHRFHRSTLMDWESQTTTKQFLSYLLHGSSIAFVKTNPVGQGIIYIVNQQKMLIPKPILLPFTVNFMTGNLELAELINRLVHSFSYPKRYEIALRKWSRFSSSILEAINQYCQFP